MKTRKFLWAVLPMMAAALAMTACGGDDDTDTKPVPVSPTDPTDKTEKTEKSIPYTVTVKGDPETTRATVNADGKTMNFAADDELYISDGGDIHGVLTLQSGAGSDAATFSGTLYYEASTPPNSSTELTATLVSGNNKNKVAVITDGKVEGFTYPTENNVCSTLAEAVSGYSQLTGKGNYGSGEIVLYQTTAFLKFTVNLEDGTSVGNSVPVEVRSDGSTTIGEGTVSASGTTQFVDIYAVFYVPVEGGTVISKNANMWVGSVGTEDDESITYGASTNKKLTGGNVYTVSKTKDFVRLWANGPVWATKNLKASGVLARGKYYAWGETTGLFKEKEKDYAFNWTNYKLGNETSLDKYNEGDGKTTLESVDDAANADATPKGIWRMPKGTEFQGLIDNTDYAWTKVSSFYGGKFTGKGSYVNKAIFLPAAGYWVGNTINNDGVGEDGRDGRYWSSSLTTGNAKYARFLLFDATTAGARTNSRERCTGRPIRPVKN